MKNIIERLRDEAKASDGHMTECAVPVALLNDAVDSLEVALAALREANIFLLNEGNGNSGDNPLNSIWLALAKMEGK